MTSLALNQEALQNSNLAHDPVHVLGAVSDKSIKIVPSDHSLASDMISEAFEGAVFIRDGAVAIADTRLAEARETSGEEIIFEECNEALKSLDNANALTKTLAKKSPRSIIVMGSGCLINLATYAVAGQDKPVRLTIIPTNAMSIADVAFGGLGLVNSNSKNDVRKNRDPDLIVLSRSIFSAAPKIQQSDGQIEVIKHLMFQETGSNIKQISELLSPSSVHTSDALFDSAALGMKLNILLRYAMRSGQKTAGSVLTFGHAHAHALEKQSGYQLRHSEAVRFGMALDCSFTRPDLSEMLQQKAAWSALLVHTANGLLSDDGLLNLAMYDTKYLLEKTILCLHPHVVNFPYNIGSSYVSRSEVSSKIKDLLQ